MEDEALTRRIKDNPSCLARGERMGLLTRERLQREINLLREVGVLDKPVTVDDVAALEFVAPP